MLGRFEYLVLVWRFGDHMIRLVDRVQIIRTIASYKEDGKVRTPEQILRWLPVRGCMSFYGWFARFPYSCEYMSESHHGLVLCFRIHAPA